MQPLGWQSIFHRGGLSSVGRLMVILLVFPVVVLTGYTWVTLHYAYSLGERFGYVQKTSNKGWLCKTWEGELAMTTVPGTAPQIFQFSVRDDATAQRIEQRRYCITYFTLTRYVGTEWKISFHHCRPSPKSLGGGSTRAKQGASSRYFHARTTSVRWISRPQPLSRSPWRDG